MRSDDAGLKTTEKIGKNSNAHMTNRQFLKVYLKKIPGSDILPRPGSALDFAFILIIVWC
jgi:hypothetical protein